MKRYLAILLVFLSGCNTIDRGYRDSSSNTPDYTSNELDRKNRKLVDEQRLRREREINQARQLQEQLQEQQARARLESERLRLENERQRQHIIAQEEELRRRQREYQQARLDNERRQRSLAQSSNQRPLQRAVPVQDQSRQQQQATQKSNANQNANQEEKDLQQAIENSLVTAREEERRREQVPQASEQQSEQASNVAGGDYRDNDYRLAGNTAMELSRRNGRNPTREELITAWKNSIGVTQAQAERIYADMFGG
ncbi:MAG: hypothetical protein NT128_03580 [Proteobacteria bacterium]|nr:hypothetical protein [Pseudomonadota bacterium]